MECYNEAELRGRSVLMFLRVGHRGARADETENTLESFEKAIALGVNAVELDVRRSKDGQLIVSHDDTLKRVFGIDLPVHESTLEELQQATGNRLPSLQEALRFIDGKAEKILVELKEAGYEKKVLDLLRTEKLGDRVIIVSFHSDALANVRKLDKKIETGLVYAKFRNPVEAALELHAQYLLPLYRFVHTKDVEKAHRSNLKMIVWTINTKEEIKKYMAKGVDGIATDRPDIFSQQIRF
jgi:glycerophosphoryl diester phosphodiesterase